MIGLLLFAFGALILIVILYDFLCTTISLSGLGPLSSGMTSFLWRMGRRFTLESERRLGVSIRGAIGPCILAAIAAMWIVLHLAGYTLMFLAGSSLENPRTGAPATFIETVSFSGSALSTLGASIVSPTNGWWDVLSMIAAINGMIVLTLSVSFTLSILQTTLAARALAARYHVLQSKEEDQDMEEALGRAAPLGPEMCKLAVDLTASPLPWVFVPADPTMSFPAAVSGICACLEEADLASRTGDPKNTEIDELRWGLGLLGRHAAVDGRSDITSARLWAQRYNLPPRRKRPSRTPKR